MTPGTTRGAAAATIPLGYAVGSGDPVAIPIGHMAVTGQTQAAGKTTALEALACRLPQDYRILAFRTKRGESGFASAGPSLHRPRPFFRERADWEFVQSILEATLRERMKFERGWIMRASKGASTLAEVHANVKRLMAAAKGLSQDVYYQLDTYLEKVVPQVRTLGSPTALVLAPRLNVMDLSTFSLEMQGLIIASCLDSVYQTNHHTILVIPEAWEFLPRTRRSPVTVAAEGFVRKGAALKNFLWIDSQDLSGVHTPILKQISVWLLGVQREINEAKRTIAHVHGGRKPKVDQIAGLGLGQFIACFGGQAVPTYAQPAWMSEAEAVGTAKTGQILGRDRFRLTEEEDAMVDQQVKEHKDALAQENLDLKQQLATLERQMNELQSELSLRRSGLPAPARPNAAALMQEAAPAPIKPLHQSPKAGESVDLGRDFTDDDLQDAVIAQMVRGIKRRLGTDPELQAVLLQVQAARPEIVVQITPRVITIDGSTPRGRLARVIANGFLDVGRKSGEIRAEINQTGSEIVPSRMSEYLADFVTQGFLARTPGDRYIRSAGLKVSTRELTAV